MTGEREFATHVVDLLQAFAPCEAKRMFGGYGIFLDGLMFALIADGRLYLKADAGSRARFLDEGAEPFTYLKQDREFQLSYYSAPDAFFEDREATVEWARLAFDAALRGPRAKGNKPK